MRPKEINISEDMYPCFLFLSKVHYLGWFFMQLGDRFSSQRQFAL